MGSTRPWLCLACAAKVMSETDRELRSKLTEAREKLRRELEILKSPSTGGGGADNRSAIAALEAELQQVEDALAGR
jgi:hypothetical protein